MVELYLSYCRFNSASSLACLASRSNFRMKRLYFAATHPVIGWLSSNIFVFVLLLERLSWEDVFDVSLSRHHARVGHFQTSARLV